MRRATLLGLIVVLTACSGKGPQRVGAQPSWRGSGDRSPTAAPMLAPVTFAPAGAAVRRYNEPVVAPPPSALGDATVAAVREAAQKAGTRIPVPDARLFRACAELAEIVPEEGIVSYGLVEFALQRNGIIEPSPHLLVVWGEIDQTAAIVEQLQPRLAEILADGAHARVGIGVAKRAADGTGAVVFALQGSGVSTSPIPRSVPTGGKLAIDAVVDARYRDPEVFVTRSAGGVERVDLKRSQPNSFTANVACGTSVGRQQIEITAVDSQGSTVLANFPVWCGAEPPVSVTITPTQDDALVTDTGEAERRLLAMLNRDRAAANLPPLAWDEKVAEVSRGHSLDMRTTKIVAHVSPTTGSAADRTKAAKIKTALVLENVARAYGLGEAHQGLMNSPGHRANMLSAAATHVGIGVVFGEEISGRREIFITQVFTRIPPKIDPSKATEEIVQKVGTVKKVVHAPKLAAIAQQLADQLAAGKSREQAYPAVRKQVDALGNMYLRVSSVITAASDIDSLDGPSLLGEIRPDDIGVGIAQGTHPEIGEGAVWIVLLLANRRP